MTGKLYNEALGVNPLSAGAVWPT